MNPTVEAKKKALKASIYLELAAGAQQRILQTELYNDPYLFPLEWAKLKRKAENLERAIPRLKQRAGDLMEEAMLLTSEFDYEVIYVRGQKVKIHYDAWTGEIFSAICELVCSVGIEEIQEYVYENLLIDDNS